MTRLPEPTRHPFATLQAHGAAMLAFLLAERCTATLTDEDLELADTAALRAVAAREMAESARERLSEARHLIAQSLKTRRRIAADLTMRTEAEPEERSGGSKVLRPVVSPVLGPGGMQAVADPF